MLLKATHLTESTKKRKKKTRRDERKKEQDKVTSVHVGFQTAKCFAHSRPSANRNSELECRGPGTRSKIPARKSKIAAESSCEGACFRKVFSALFSVRLASVADPACSQDQGVVQPCLCFDYSSCWMFDEQAASLRFSGRLDTWALHCVREVVSGLNRQIDSTTSVQCSDGSIGKPGKGLRFCSACAGARRSTLTPCDQLFTCVLPAYHGSRGSHCPSVCLCLSCTSSIWRREISAHTARRPDGRCSVFWELYHRQGKRSAARSSRAASSRRSSCSLRLPCSWSSNKKADKLSAANEPWSNARRRFLFLRQANRKKDARKPRSLVRRFAERSSNPKFGIAIFEYSRPAASRNDLEFSICRRSILIELMRATSKRLLSEV